jgi:hypothetical protein
MTFYSPVPGSQKLNQNDLFRFAQKLNQNELLEKVQSKSASRNKKK